MKKVTALLLTCLLALFALPATADDLGVQIIGGDTAMETLSLDDVKLEQTHEIGGK